MRDGGVSPVPSEARPYQGQRAGLVTRLIANVIDAFVVGAFLVVGYLAVNGLVFLVNPRGFHFTETTPLLSMTSGLVGAVLYLSAGWGTTGRTYGCHLMGLRVVSLRGRRPHPFLALVRAVLCVLFPIGLLWCAGSRTRRSIQDVVLRTSVIYDWSPRRERRGVHGPS